MKTKICKGCSKEFQTDVASESLEKFITHCPDCVDAETQREAQEESEQRARSRAMITESRNRGWLEFCPALFQDTEAEKLPCPIALQSLMQWQYGPRGLVLIGPSGKGKSRSAWILLEREYKAGRRIKVLDSMAGLKYAARFNESAASVENWVESLIEVDLLFMDDIFKNKLTDSFEGIIFTLIDQRTQNRKPIIVTSNDTGKTLAGRMTEDRAEPLIRRLRENATTIAFK